MKWLLPAIVTIVITMSCNSITRKSPEERKVVKAVEIRTTFSGMFDDAYVIYHLNTTTLYQTSYQYTLNAGVVTDVKSDGLEITYIYDSIAKSEIRQQYFVFSNDSSFGYTYDPLSPADDGLRLERDSVLQARTGHFELLPKVLTLSPTSAAWSVAGDVLTDTYQVAATDSTPSLRQNLSYSTRMNTLPETFSHTLDSAKGMKLFKIETMVDSFYNRRKGERYPAMTFLHEMKPVEIKDVKKVLYYFDRYKKSTGPK